MVLDEILYLPEIEIEKVCINGYRLTFYKAEYAIHYGVILAYRVEGSRIILINSDYADRGFTRTDLKVIRALDPSFIKRKDKYLSDNYEIRKICFKDA